MSDIDHLLGEGPGAKWIRDHRDYHHKDCCLLWPFALDTNGYAHIGGKHLAVHRLMCEHRNGPAPSEDHHAAHSCSRGHDGCVNQWHLDWKTPTENQEDRYQNSGLVRRAKLTPAEVDEIRALKGRATLTDIAKQFGVSPTNIHQIHCGKTWTKTVPRQRSFTEDDIRQIRSTPRTRTDKMLAEEYGVTFRIIQQIRSRSTYRWVEDRQEEAAE